MSRTQIPLKKSKHFTMDYTQAFKTLSTSPRDRLSQELKAVLLLAVIDMYESTKIYDNEIIYDDKFVNAFAKNFKLIFNNEVFQKAKAYEAFWYMSGEPFWHLVPNRGSEDIADLMLDSSIRPSETTIKDGLKYVELDEDLYFLMTISSGRTSLRKALLEEYSNLPNRQIEKISQSLDSFNDKSQEALETFKNILASDLKSGTQNDATHIDSSILERIDEDLRIELCFNYYSFLRNHPSDRKNLQSIFSSVPELYSKLYHGDVDTSNVEDYFVPRLESFLQELKASLMSCNNATELIEGIGTILSHFQPTELRIVDNETEDDEPWNSKESESIIESEEGNESDYVETPQLDFFVENGTYKCAIYNRLGEIVFSDKGKLKIINGIPYRINYKSMCLTIKGMEKSDDVWIKGPSVIVAYKETDLYDAIDPISIVEDIEDIDVCTWNPKGSRIKFRGTWYAFNGTALESDSAEDSNEIPTKTSSNVSSNFIPKGKLKAIDDVAKSSYDYLWMMSIVDFMREYDHSPRLSYDEIACMMIANAWEILDENPELKSVEESLAGCIEYLIAESNECMDQKLDWRTPSEIVYEAIKDFPMAGAFEDAVDELLENVPSNVLSLWLPDLDMMTMTIYSQNFQNACLYALHPKSVDPFIKINPKWKRSLFFEHDNLRQYYKEKYIAYLKSIK